MNLSVSRFFAGKVAKTRKLFQSTCLLKQVRPNEKTSRSLAEALKVERPEFPSNSFVLPTDLLLQVVYSGCPLTQT
jgi:hypothetical protein